MPDYQTSKIYKLSSPSNNLMYIGSTTQTLAHRLAKHKSSFNLFNNGKRGYLTAFKILECEDYKIELIENYPCNNKEQLFKREGEHIKNLECVNKRIEGRTPEETKEYNKQYQEANKEEIKQKKKEYEEAHKEEIKQYKKQYREANKEEIKQKDKQRREANKDKIKENNKQYREANKEYDKQYKEAHKEEINKRRRDQRKQKKEESQGTTI